jgi:hypothetical protein
MRKLCEFGRSIPLEVLIASEVNSEILGAPSRQWDMSFLKSAVNRDGKLDEGLSRVLHGKMLDTNVACGS